VQHGGRATPQPNTGRARAPQERTGAAAATGSGARRACDEGESETWLERVKKQVDFYFGDANLRRDKFLRKKMGEGNGFVELSTILQFNRIRALRCRYPAQLVQAIRKSNMLVLSEDKTRVQRDFAKMPREDVDPTPRTVYVEGLPLSFGIDDLAQFFARYGSVRLVQLPQHRETREPRGFCFVEFAADAEADAAVAGLEGSWPSNWPPRYDGKTLRAMSKRSWLEYKREYHELCRRARGSSSAAASGVGGSQSCRASEAGLESSSSGVQTTLVSASASASAPASALCPPVAPSSLSSAPDLAKAAVAPTGVSSKPRERSGCLIRISGYSQPQTALSIRQFAEHAVPVEYCDLAQPDAVVAHLRLACPEDCKLLLEDLRLSQRMLGWLRPDVHVLGPEEEAAYWRDVDKRHAARDAAQAPPVAPSEELLKLSKKKRKRLLRPPGSMPQHPQGIISGGPVKTSTISRWPFGPGARARATSSGADKQSGARLPVVGSSSFVDTVGGNPGFVAAGFGRSRRPRRRGGVGRPRKDSSGRPADASTQDAAVDPQEQPKRAAEAPADEPPAKAPRQSSGSIRPSSPGMPPPSPMLLPSGAKPKRKPPPRIPPSTPRSILAGPPRTPVPRPPDVAEPLVPPRMPTPRQQDAADAPMPPPPSPAVRQPNVLPSPGRLESGKQWRDGNSRGTELHVPLPPPSPVALRRAHVPCAPAAAAGNGNEGDDAVGDKGADKGQDSMLADTDDILGLMDA